LARLTLTGRRSTGTVSGNVPETTLSEIAACLWDLRAQCEQATRTLTDAQRLAEDYRDADNHRSLVRRRLLANLEAVLHTNAAIREAAQDCLALVDKLPHADAADP
jgi:hypothetical protein